MSDLTHLTELAERGCQCEPVFLTGGSRAVIKTCAFCKAIRNTLTPARLRELAAMEERLKATEAALVRLGYALMIFREEPQGALCWPFKPANEPRKDQPT